jgi:hypothetical protein
MAHRRHVTFLVGPGIRLGLVIAAACLIALSFAASATAYEDPPVKLGAEPGNLESSAEYLLENSPRKISGIGSTAESEALYKTVTEPPPGADTIVQDELESETPSLLQKVGAWVWNKVPEVTVAVGGFWAGWEIGSAIYGEFFEEASPGGGSSTLFADEWHVKAPGEDLLSEAAGDIYSPGWGSVGYSSEGQPFGRVTETGGCEAELYGDGIPLFVPAWEHHHFCGSSEYHDYVLWKPFEVKQCGKAGVTCPGIEPVPYEGEGQPTAPTPEALRESLKKALETSEYSIYNRLYNFEQQPENYPDPRITKKKVDDEERRCDRGIPKFENPGGNGSPEPFAKKEETAFLVGTLPPGIESPSPVYLRWGTTSWLEAGKSEPEYLDQWGGWGYRKIVAKHSWNALDRAETENALLSGTPELAGNGFDWLYKAHDEDPGTGGVGCERVVVVGLEIGEDPETKEENPAPRGIITSYNRVIPGEEE